MFLVNWFGSKPVGVIKKSVALTCLILNFKNMSIGCRIKISKHCVTLHKQSEGKSKVD